MAHNSSRIEFPSLQAMTAHLDRWAATSLATPEHWDDAMVGTRSWLDYSARNQVLLASYGVDGPVAGPETWRLVPSTTEGRGCAIRAGEHGYPVRVPITSGGTEPDPYLGGQRPTRAAVERWEWRPVFETAQLARRPAPGALTAIDVPDHLRGPSAQTDLAAAVRKVAGATIRGPLPRTNDPTRLLGDAAIRLRRSHKRPPLDEHLAGQVAWLVLDRVGHAPTEHAPAFDPAPLDSRERWERLQDVLEPARKLTAALGVTVGVDLTASPLPRMEIIDDRVVPAGRRHRLPAASLEQLPIGRWVTVGPYTAAEWSARGEHASGIGAFLRLNKTAYLAAVETGDGATWRLEDIAARTGNGLLVTGSARTLNDARAEAIAAVRDRYPALTAPTVDTGPSPAGAVEGWEQMPRAGRPAAAELWHLTNDITLFVLPAPGGRWQPALQTPSTDGLELLPLQPTQQQARDQAEVAGRRIARVAMIADPATSDRSLAAFADNGPYSRTDLAHLISGRLNNGDTARVVDAEPAELVELLGAAGFSPATTVAVLAADGVDAATAATLLPAAGVPIPDGIRVLHERWDIPNTLAAELLDATATEMRTAGCTPTEIMAVRPRDVLRTLPDDPRLWELAAGSMATAGHPTSTIVDHLVAHAPTPNAFTTGLLTVVEPDEALVVAARRHAHPDQLAAVSEAVGLSPADTATALTTKVDDHALLDVLNIRCEGDTISATQIATEAGVERAAVDSWLHPAALTNVTPIRSSIDIDSAALLERLPPAGPATFDDHTRVLDTLMLNVETAGLEPAR
jgi:hypothetical protein